MVEELPRCVLGLAWRAALGLTEPGSDKPHDSVKCQNKTTSAKKPPKSETWRVRSRWKCLRGQGSTQVSSRDVGHQVELWSGGSSYPQSCPEDTGLKEMFILSKASVLEGPGSQSCSGRCSPFAP